MRDNHRHVEAPASGTRLRAGAWDADGFTSLYVAPGALVLRCSAEVLDVPRLFLAEHLELAAADLEERVHCAWPSDPRSIPEILASHVFNRVYGVAARLAPRVGHMLVGGR